MYSQQERYWIALSQSPGLTPRAFYAMMDGTHGDAVRAWRSPELARGCLTGAAYARFAASLDDARVDGAIRRLEDAGVAALTHLSDDYPEPLRFIDEPPAVLYVRGATQGWLRHSVAVVGTRTPSRDGLRAAGDVARDLARAGVVVVSGMARGIDRAAHEGCLAAGGRTVAVLGSGPDVHTSHDAAQLAGRIEQGGGSVVSEYPPGTPAYRWSFPRRNRIISGLVSGVLLAEGASDSGALITLRFAKAQRRVRFALPGSIYAPGSAAPNSLLRDGAVAATCGGDILRHLGWAEAPAEARAQAAPTPPSGPEQAVLKWLRRGEWSFDELAERAAIGAAQLNTLLTILEMRGIIEQLPGRRFRACVTDR